MKFIIAVAIVAFVTTACGNRMKWVRPSPEVVRAEVPAGSEVFIRTHAGEEFVLKISQITSTLLIGLDAQDRSVQVLIRDIALLEQKKDSNVDTVVGVGVGTVLLYIVLSFALLMSFEKLQDGLNGD